MNILGTGYRKIKSSVFAHRIYNKSYEIVMAALTHPLGVKFFSIRRNAKKDSRKISLAITHYNRSHLITSALTNVLQDERINEVVIYDDLSTPEEFEKMQAIVKKLSDKISIYRGEQNLGPYNSKIAAVSKCRNEWAIILDSDNALSRNYVDIIYQIATWNPQLLYCPSYAKPEFNFRYWANVEINLHHAKEIILNSENIKLFRCLLNDGNYFVNVQNYVVCGNANEHLLKAADVIAFNYSWLKTGYGLYIVNNLTYYHRVHSGSYQIGTWKISRQVVDDIIKSITNVVNEECSDKSV